MGKINPEGVTVENEIPFAKNVLSRLMVISKLNDRPDDLSRPVSLLSPYVYWQEVRSYPPHSYAGSNKQTGFEGYFVSGKDTSAEIIRKGVNESSGNIWRMASRGRDKDYGKRRNLIRFIEEGVFDEETLAVFSSAFGAELARLRMELHLDPNRALYREETHQLVDPKMQIFINPLEERISQRYQLQPRDPYIERPKIIDLFNGNDKFLAMLALNIGKVGHPLVRQVFKV